MWGRRGEDVIVQRLADKLRGVGFEVFTHVFLNDLELDVVALEHQRGRSLAYVYEVKVKPRPKLLKQISKRIELADYLYVVVSPNLYPWVLKKVEPFVGLILFINDDLYVFRKACFLGKGEKLVKILKDSNVSKQGIYTLF